MPGSGDRVRRRAGGIGLTLLLTACTERGAIPPGGSSTAVMRSAAPPPSASAPPAPSSAPPRSPPRLVPGRGIALSAPAEALSMTAQGHLLFVDEAHVYAAPCGSSALRDLGSFADVHALASTPDGAEVGWLAFDGPHRLEVASWSEKRQPRFGSQLEGLTADQGAFYLAERVDDGDVIHRLERASTRVVTLAVLRGAHVTGARVTRSHLWLVVHGTLMRLNLARRGSGPLGLADLTTITALPPGTDWDVLAAEDAALVVEGAGVSLFEGATPKRRTLGLPQPAREICAVEGALYWTDAGGSRLSRTTLSASLSPDHTEVVTSEGRPRGVACAGSYVAWSSEGEGRYEIRALRRGGAEQGCF